MDYQDKESEKNFFDHEEEYSRFDERSFKKILTRLQKSTQIPGNASIADMGCGDGSMTKWLRKTYPHATIYGIDLSPVAIANASKESLNIEFITGDIEATSFADNSMDLLCYSAVLHHFQNFEKVAKEAYRILKPGGYFFSFDPHYYNPAFLFYRCPYSPFYSRAGLTPGERLLTVREVSQIFSSAGFEAKATTMSGITFAYLNGSFAKKFLWLYNVFDRLLGITPLSRVLGSWVIGYGKKALPTNELAENIYTAPLL